jgi:TrmH family RNA methyltransferase
MTDRPPQKFKNIDIVLVRPLRPGNVGSAARAIKNMGFPRLVLVDPCDHLASEAYQMAYGAHDILQEARLTKTLPEAVSKARFIVGMTGHNYRGYEMPIPLPQVVPEILAHGQRHPVAILFGSESTGLTVDEILLCQRLAIIPTAGTHTSLNLAQAVVVVLYELFRGSQEKISPAPLQLAPVAETERLYRELSELLTRIQFIKGRQGKSLILRLRQIFARTGLAPQEVRMLRGIVRQIMWLTCHSQGSRKKKSPKDL